MNELKATDTFNLLNALIGNSKVLKKKRFALISHELFDFTEELVARGELAAQEFYVNEIDSAVMHETSNGSHSFTYGMTLPQTLLKGEKAHECCLVSCTYSMNIGEAGKERTFQLPIPKERVSILNIRDLQYITVTINSYDFAAVLTPEVYSGFMRVIKKYSMIPQVSIRLTCFNESGVEKVKKKILESALERINESESAAG